MIDQSVQRLVTAASSSNLRLLAYIDLSLRLANPSPATAIINPQRFWVASDSRLCLIPAFLYVCLSSSFYLYPKPGFQCTHHQQRCHRQLLQTQPSSAETTRPYCLSVSAQSILTVIQTEGLFPNIQLKGSGHLQFGCKSTSQTLAFLSKTSSSPANLPQRGLRGSQGR